jgi:hypothetical protein
MQGLADFAGQIGEAFAVLLPTFCYLAALGSFLFAAWGFWMQSQPHNPYRGRPWIPFLSLVLSGAFASFDQVLSMALASGGSGVTVSIASLSSYTPPTAPSGSTLMGASPSETLVNVVTLFQAFFQSFGAMCAFFALLSWRSVVNGHANRSQIGCVVQFVFGIMLINILAIANGLIAMFA